MPKPTRSAAGGALPASQSRRSFMATSALAVTAAAVPVAVMPKAQAAETDPIFAAMDEHARAARSLGLAWLEESHLEDELHLADDHPSRIEAAERSDLAQESNDAAYLALFTTAPTTIPGLIALLDYLPKEDWTAKDTVNFEETVLGVAALGGDELKDVVLKFFPMLADALRNITAIA